jgi:para-aminobenzoate synthetase/4-amino-4-deoxychorismate lyase
MGIIRRLEGTPRRAYTGTIGFIVPGTAQFNVAIRTLVVNLRSGEAEYGVGSGIVWQSDPASEWEECLAKSRALREVPQEFELLETMLCSQGVGIALLDRHLRRLEESADYFGFTIDTAAIREQLFRACSESSLPRAKLRLLLSRAGSCRVEVGALHDAGGDPVVLGLARTPVDSEDRALYHKTTDRRVYERALTEAPGCEDALLFNERGEVTESTVANVALRIGAELHTPPLRCGLLAGTYREWMLGRGMLLERVIRVEEVLAGAELYLMNSVRGMYPAALRPGSALRR